MAFYRQDRQRSDKSNAALAEAIGVGLGTGYVIEADDNEDNTHATDMMLGNGVRISCRTRDMGYWESYAHQFTIRYLRPNCKLTEYAKIMHGWGKYMIYAWADGGYLHDWYIIDLDVFRNNIAPPTALISNTSADNSTAAVYNYSQFPPNLIVCRKSDYADQDYHRVRYMDKHGKEHITIRNDSK